MQRFCQADPLILDLAEIAKRLRVKQNKDQKGAWMPTLLSPQAFENLTDIRKTIAANEGLKTLGTPMDVFVPWVGSALESSRGIYYLGAGLDAEETDPNSSATFEAALEATEQFVQSGMQGRRHSPFWNFLDGLTTDLLGGPSDTVSDRWGWSNLLKIGWSAGNPASWPTKLIELQRNGCKEALREELSRLRDSLIFVASDPEFSILHPVVGDKTKWNKDYEHDGIWWLKDNLHGNLYIHGYHPGHARRRRFYDAELQRAVTITRSFLSPFDA